MFTFKALKALSRNAKALNLLANNTKYSQQFISLSSNSKSYFADRRSDKFDEKNLSDQTKDEAERYSEFADPLTQEFSYSSARENEDFIINTKRRAEELAKQSGQGMDKSQKKTTTFTQSSDINRAKDSLKDSKDAAKTDTGKKSKMSETMRDSMRGVAQRVTEYFGTGLGGSMSDFARKSDDSIRPDLRHADEQIGSFAPGTEKRRGFEAPMSESIREKPDLRASAREEQRLKSYYKAGSTQAPSKQEKEADRKELRKETEARKDELLREEAKPGKKMLDLESSKDWESLLNSEKPIIVDFYMEGDNECRRLYPMLMDKFTDSKEIWVLAGANIEKVSDLAREMKIESVPTVLLIHKGKVLAESRNASDVDSLIERANSISKE